MFESTIALFNRYYEKMLVDDLPTFNDDLALEVKKRIEQLDFLYCKIERKQLRYFDLDRKVYSDDSLEQQIKDAGGSIVVVGSDERSEMRELMFEIELYTESFYYLAGRIYTVLKKRFLPGLETFECVGARDVRNKLLEHADGKQSQVYVQSFGIGAIKARH